jgi:hypothetical protein
VSPEDNPFEEQTLLRVNPETQAREEFKLRPLTLVRDGSRYTPAEDRYVPTVAAPQDAAPQVVREPAVPQTPATPATGVAPESAPPVMPRPAPPGPAPRRPVDLPGVPVAPDEQDPTWFQPPQAPGEVLPGALRGSDDALAHPEREPDPTDHPGERFVPSVIGAQAAPQQPGAQEEHAERVDPAIGEETGQAKPPVAPPEEGEWSWAEEVGSPEAPTHDTTEDGG